MGMGCPCSRLTDRDARRVAILMWLGVYPATRRTTRVSLARVPSTLESHSASPPPQGFAVMGIAYAVASIFYIVAIQRLPKSAMATRGKMIEVRVSAGPLCQATIDSSTYVHSNPNWYPGWSQIHGLAAASMNLQCGSAPLNVSQRLPSSAGGRRRRQGMKRH